MSELLITSSLDPIKEGQTFSKSLPRHVTVWQYFELPDSDVHSFIQETQKAIEAFSPFEIIGMEHAQFGPNNDVSVRRVKALGNGATLITLHTVLGEIIERHDGTIQNPEWAYENYNPHITFVDGHALDESEYVQLKTIELIEKDGDSRQKIVRKVWKLDEA